jgi:hypothetical protein
MESEAVQTRLAARYRAMAAVAEMEATKKTDRHAAQALRDLAASYTARAAQCEVKPGSPES